MLHVLVGADCNNNCSFCMESDREGRRRHVLGQSPEDVHRFIDNYGGRDEILFTSGEPTLNERLLEYARHARAARFRTIGVISNGRRLSYRKYAEALLAAGVNKVTISIHGATAAVHDSLTRTPGSFAQSAGALSTLGTLKRQRRFDLHTSTVLVRRNLELLREIHRFLSSFPVDQVCFNVMMAKGGGDERFDVLMPRYSDVAARFSELARELDAGALERTNLADVPVCAMRGVDARLLGDQEHFEQFETDDSSGVATHNRGDLERMWANGNGDAARLLERQADIHLEGDGAYYLTTRELKDDLSRDKRAECRGCTLDSSCPGVWRRYVDAYGWSEFVPVQAAPARARSRAT
jgi:MoaA/NifB/PqqE/SkfB family radical SAM enzyme